MSTNGQGYPPVAIFGLKALARAGIGVRPATVRFAGDVCGDVQMFDDVHMLPYLWIGSKPHD